MQEIAKVADKWIKLSQSKRMATTEEAEAHMMEVPSQLDLIENTTILQNDIDASKKWDKQFEVLSGI